MLTDIGTNIKTEDRLRKKVVSLRQRKAEIESMSKDEARAEHKVFEETTESFYNDVAKLKIDTGRIKKKLSNLFNFVDKCFGDGNEMLILITELTMNRNSVRFIAEKGCDEYYKFDKKYQLYERNKELLQEIERIDSLTEL